MPLPVELDRKIRNRFDELIEDLEILLTKLDEYNHDHYLRFTEWVVKISGLLTMVFGDSNLGQKYVEFVERGHGPGVYVVGGEPHKELLRTGVQHTHATLIRDNFVNGFYDGLDQQIIANVSADYMEQAEELLGEGIEGQYGSCACRSPVWRSIGGRFTPLVSEADATD